MTEDPAVTNLNKILELTTSMLDAARKGDWEQVQSIEQQRKKIFEQTFPLDPDSLSDAAIVARQVQKISDMDKETMTLVTAGSKELSGLINKISAGRHAVNAYRDVQGR